MGRQANNKLKTRNLLYDIAFIGPAFVVFLFIVLLPFFISILLSFTSWNGQSKAQWVGLYNYELIFTGVDAFWRYFVFTLKYAFLFVILVNLVGLLLALLLTSKNVMFIHSVRTMVILPYMVSGLVLGFIWQFIFTKIMPSLGGTLGLHFLSVSWLGSAQYAFWAMVIVSVWQMAGYIMVIYIAAILNVPAELIESAKIDGAAGLQLFNYIKLPMIMPAVTIGLFYAANIAFKVFDVNFALTNGGPFNSTTSVAMDIYFEAFARGNQGLGCAKSMILFIVVAALTLLQLRLTQRKEVQL